jgi:DHA3 family tetracycline resistance protein-like MFS transporter
MRRLNALTVYLIMSGVTSLAYATIFTGLAVYYISQVGLSPFQLVLVGTVLEGTILLFELPTGVVADTYGRRLSVIIAMFVLGLAFLLEGALPFVAGILLAEAVRGLGHTFESGALDAWLADELGEDRVGSAYARAGQVAQIAGLVGTGLSVGLSYVSLQLPVLLGGALLVALGVFLAFTMPETGFVPANGGERNPLKAMRNTLRDGARVVRGSPLLLALVASQLVVGAGSEGFDRLWEAHLINGIGLPYLSPVAWLGIISVAGQVVGFIALRLSERHIERASATSAGSARALLLLQGLFIVFTVAFALAGNLPLALVALLLRGAVGALIGPLAGAWTAQQIEGRVRATVLSMAGLSNAFGQTAGGPGVGFIGNRSLRAAMVLAGLLFSPLLLLYSWARRRSENDAPPEAEGEPVVSG